MQLPAEVKAVRSRYVAKFPIPQGPPGPEIEEQVRQWSIGLAEQVAFEIPGEGWGTKRADPNRPISKDGLARQDDEDRGGRLWIWDMVTGAGTGLGRLVENPEGEDITGQVFVPVTPRNRLETAIEPPPVKPGPQPLPPADLGPVVAYLSKIDAKLDTLPGRVDAVDASIGDTRHAVENLGNLLNALVQQQQGIFDRLTALESKPCSLPDGAIRLYGRKIGDVDFPGN